MYSLILFLLVTDYFNTNTNVLLGSNIFNIYYLLLQMNNRMRSITAAHYMNFQPFLPSVG